MRNTLLAGAAALTLAGCADQERFEQYPQEGFITANQERIDGVLSTIEVFEAGTTDELNCIRNDNARGVADLLAEDNDRENVDVCIFPNEGDGQIEAEIVPIS